MADKKTSLLDQALNAERAEKLKRKRGGKKFDETKVLDVIQFLLPNYDFMGEKGKAWHAAEQLEKGIKGGVRSGKTYRLAANAIALSYINRPYLHLSLAPTDDNIDEAIIPVLEELCEANNLRYVWSKSSRMFKIHHGLTRADTANILFVSGDSFFKGVTAASGDVNEPFSIAKEKVLIWWERISHPKSKRLERAWGGTAEPEKMDWGEEYFQKEKIETERLYVDTFTTYENTYLSKEYVSELEARYSVQLREVYMLGKHVSLVQKPAYSFDLTRDVVDDDYPVPDTYACGEGEKVTMILGFDFNVDPITCGELTVVPKKAGSETMREVIQTNEYIINNSRTKELCDYIIRSLERQYATENLSIIITGDASGKQRKTSAAKTDYQIIKRKFEEAEMTFRMYVPEVNPFVRDRVNDVNVMLETGEFKIMRKCKDSIKDRGLVQWKQGVEGFVIDKSKKTITHITEAVDYGLMAAKKILRSGGLIRRHQRKER